MKVKYLIIGAGVSGLTFASQSDDYLIIEKENEPGGLCRTIKKNGFTWDYSGHFFHFQDDKIKKKFLDNINANEIIYKEKNTKIFIKNHLIDFPFQKNIHQLEKQDFIDCLYDLYFKEEKETYVNFEEMLYGKFGKSITNMFLKPYNEKLYACDLNSLEANAMRRFFPYADLKDIIKNMKLKKNESYNDKFLYPKNGAYSFIEVLLNDIKKDRLWLSTELTNIDISNKLAITSKGEIEYEYLINTMPYNQFCRILKYPLEFPLTSNKVLVFNLGFNKKSELQNVHWIYYPEKEYNFYRVGFYDNILQEDRLSMYVEIGFSENDDINITEQLKHTLLNLKKCGIIIDHELVDYHCVIMNPAYVHISEKSQAEKKKTLTNLSKNGIYSIGRYGNWTYCSIEDCIKEALSLKMKLGENCE